MARTDAQRRWSAEHETQLRLTLTNERAANLRAYCKSIGKPVTTYLIELARQDMARNGCNIDNIDNIDKVDKD